jgi:hypothetical protein
MKRFLPTGLIVFAGVLGIAVAAGPAEENVTKLRKKFDLREAILRRFFKENHCPAESYAGIFVTEADAHGLDWRLLPSLSLIESGGGRVANGNNLFGWANGHRSFDSIASGIHLVAEALALAKPYRGKDLEAKLFTYNHDTRYGLKVTSIMSQISPTVEPLPEAAGAQ